MRAGAAEYGLFECGTRHDGVLKAEEHEQGDIDEKRRLSPRLGIDVDRHERPGVDPQDEQGERQHRREVGA